MAVLYPNDIELKLGFDHIRGLLRKNCLSTLGESMVNKMKFSDNSSQFEKWLIQTSEFLKILRSGDTFPTSDFIDVSTSLKKAQTEGNFLTEKELLDVAKSLTAILKCAGFLEDHKEEYPQLNELTTFVKAPEVISIEILSIIDNEARMKDNASPALLETRNRLRGKYNQVRRLVDKIFKDSVKAGYVPEGSSMAVRSGRMVIPISAEHKRRVKGFTHDESSTGQIVFIEPAEVLEGNNEIRELENEEKREIVRILTRLTHQIHLNIPDIKQSYQFLSLVDFIRAKAVLAVDTGSNLPHLVNESVVDWQNARHPLLYLSFKETGRELIPLTISMNSEKRMVIISGPNAGGKSVCLKTVGLLQYMLQCGLLVPVGDDSTFGCFSKILIDIGDEQSIENDLSTYSSHLTNMKYFLKESDRHSLVLIDEFGTGTDPQFGGPIAQSILQELAHAKARGVITTHYSNIKIFAEENEGIINGAMRFDVEKLEPLYILEMGKPGSSFSLEIAKKIGLPDDVIKVSKSIIGHQKVDVDDLLMKLERQEAQIKERDQQLKREEQRISSLEQRYTRLYEELETRKKDILNKAKDEAANLLSKTNKEIEKTIRHIKENKAQKTETKKARRNLEGLKESVKGEKTNRNPKEQISFIEGGISAGDHVLIVDQKVSGEVLSRKGKDVEVKIGGLKTTVKLNRLKKISKKLSKNINKPNTSRTFDIAQKRANFTSTLDLRGKRGEEALPMVEKFLDDALLFGIQEIKILHGKGNGILKDLVRGHLKDMSYIKSIKDEHIEHGGAGITVIDLA